MMGRVDIQSIHRQFVINQRARVEAYSMPKG